jgi:hypothetical protein
MKTITEKVERHKAFWKRDPVSRALLGFVVGGWSAYRGNPGWFPLQNREELTAGDVVPEGFVPWIEQHLAQMDDLEDDAIRPAQPFQAIPWLEAVVGCPLRSSSEHIWSEPFLSGPPGASPFDLEEIRENPWTLKYLEFLDVLAERFRDERPVGQSILRGPSDLASACMGEERFVYSLVDEPEAAKAFLEHLSELERAFFQAQWEHTPRFQGGMVIGEFNLWAPRRAFRFQEDASALLSPDSYREFVLPWDEMLCELTEYNVMHLHTTSLHLLDVILEMKSLGALQISQDEGVPLERVLPDLVRIQEAKKPLIVKGQFTEAEVGDLCERLSPKGLFIQPVVRDVGRAEHLLMSVR